MTRYCLVRGSGNEIEIAPRRAVFWLVFHLPWNFCLSISIGWYTGSAARVAELCKVVKFNNVEASCMKLQICSYTYLFRFLKHLFTGSRDSDSGRGKKLFSLLENARTVLASTEPPVQLSIKVLSLG